MKKIDNKIICCTLCYSDELLFCEDVIICKACGTKFKIDKNTMVFDSLKDSDVLDPIDKLKYFFKKFSRFYSLLVRVISPVCSNRKLIKFIKSQTESDNKTIVNIGSGNTNLSERVVNIDIFNYDNVDIVSNIERLPFISKSLDTVINNAVLEHVPSPEAVVDEISRVLKTGGLIYCFFPFIQGFHASPYDYSRRTIEGMRVLFHEYEEVELKAYGGPTSGFLWILQEWLAILFSFGNKQLYKVILAIVMLLTWPIKFLDYLLIKHPMAKNIASGFVFIGKKK